MRTPNWTHLPFKKKNQLANLSWNRWTHNLALRTFGGICQSSIYYQTKCQQGSRTLVSQDNNEILELFSQKNDQRYGAEKV